ncbi:hypothetical protein BV509_00885 [Rhodovulum sulfidophilum]|uniref:Uncharacterized protein n=1 Tax=Rhodovulum visakhapatnamense TaxID=364297 RepID=A0ABS1RI95_9RHOB|nr:hypothetical protein [Rhodovulum visakhapatnamense]MBL3569891.1 hypothetical protein [Rhodovulum visakhapatnamense]MBL3578416.1 hypothetical protein [Rhodovulum visakhapatnamense]OLS43044.1 hypothetical protein BV509_00885 [Rhodovulum sulfidophilum]
MVDRRLFSIALEERRVRHQRIVATDDGHAEQIGRAMARQRGARYLGLTEAGAGPSADPRAALDALAHLIAAPFLTLGGRSATVGDWLAAFSGGREDADLNRAMAPAGLRVYVLPSGADFYVATSPRIAFLADCFARTPWAGGAWATTLRAIEGARATNMTFAGIASRATGLPLASAMDHVQPRSVANG